MNIKSIKLISVISMCTVFSGLSAGAQTTVSEVSTTQSQIKPDDISAEKIFSLSTNAITVPVIYRGFDTSESSNCSIF